MSCNYCGLVSNITSIISILCKAYNVFKGRAVAFLDGMLCDKSMSPLYVHYCLYCIHVSACLELESTLYTCIYMYIRAIF